MALFNTRHFGLFAFFFASTFLAHHALSVQVTSAAEPGLVTNTTGEHCCTHPSISTVRTAADKGDAAAEFDLGNRYYLGVLGADLNLTEANKWLRKAADQGHENAEDELSELYAKAPKDGLGVHQDWAESYFWFLLTMKSRDPRLDKIIGPVPGMTPATLQTMTAQHEEDQDYMRKRYIEDHLSTAQITEVRKRAEAWKPASGSSVVPIPQPKAEEPRANNDDKTEYCCLHPSVSELRMLAEGGDAEAEANLGGVYFRGSWGADVDWDEAAKWLRLAGEQGNERAQDQLSQVYAGAAKAGQSIHQDWAESYFWFLLAAKARDRRLSGLVGNATEETATTPDELDAQAYREQDAKRIREIETHLTAAQIAAAKDKADQWKPSPRHHSK